MNTISEPCQTLPLASDSCDIALIDDDELAHEFFKRLLRKEKYTIEHFYGCDDALSYFEHCTAKTIFMDFYMPKMDGLELLEKIDGKLAGTNVFLCTAILPPAETLSKCEAMGVEVITKERLRRKELVLEMLKESLAGRH